MVRLNTKISITLLIVLIVALSTQLIAQPNSKQWLMFRYSQDLRGVSSAKIPEKPVLLWRFKTDGAINSSPAIAKNAVFFGSDDGNIYAVNLADGSKLWSFKTDAPVQSSPLILNNTLYIGSDDGNLYAIDSNSGALKWKYKTDGKICAAPNYWYNQTTRSTNIIVGSYDNRLHSIDSATGKAVWTFDTGNFINGAAAISPRNVAVFGGCDGILHLINLQEGKELKKIDAGAYIACSVAISENFAFFGNMENSFLCVDIEKGTNHWAYASQHFPYYSSPAVTDDKVVFGGRDKRVHCLNKKDGKLLWTFLTRAKVDSSPAIASDKVVVGSEDGRLYILNLNNGKEIWSYDTGSPITSSPAVIDSRILIGSDNGFLYCFGEK